MSLIEFIKNINPKGEILYFGGSFNPWHEGHSECIRKAPKDATIIVIPDHNPQKEINTKEYSLNESYIKSLHKNVYIYKGFFLKKKKNPTYKWITQVKKEFSNLKHSFLMGYDSYENLKSWIQFETILNNLNKLYVLNRENQMCENYYNIKTIFLGPHDFEQLASSKL
ncbi:MAG: hypothetical protein N4A33_02180 [Bacteriovoracaceae bacterium]|jgi:nicotinate-nucleotide adenylyltransferase|nr:hypothetical protein [Bacteriovoracaceae bacterium]